MWYNQAAAKQGYYRAGYQWEWFILKLVENNINFWKEKFREHPDTSNESYLLLGG